MSGWRRCSSSSLFVCIINVVATLDYTKLYCSIAQTDRKWSVCCQRTIVTARHTTSCPLPPTLADVRGSSSLDKPSLFRHRQHLFSDDFYCRFDELVVSSSRNLTRRSSICFRRLCSLRSDGCRVVDCPGPRWAAVTVTARRCWRSMAAVPARSQSVCRW